MLPSLPTGPQRKLVATLLPRPCGPSLLQVHTDLTQYHAGPWLAVIGGMLWERKVVDNPAPLWGHMVFWKLACSPLGQWCRAKKFCTYCTKQPGLPGPRPLRACFGTMERDSGDMSLCPICPPQEQPHLAESVFQELPQGESQPALSLVTLSVVYTRKPGPRFS